MPNFCPFLNGICKTSCVFFNTKTRVCLLREAALALLALSNQVEAIRESVADLSGDVVDQLVEKDRMD